jgi:immunity protein 27 of polymorphic toxin system
VKRIATGSSMNTCICEQQRRRPEVMEDLKRFMALADSIAPTLDSIARSPDGWRSLHRCRECGALWEQTYPYGGHHGGGPKCLIPAAQAPVHEYFNTVPDITLSIRRRAEDDLFISAIGPEVGPGMCNTVGCDRRCVQHSVMCPRHHFEMITHRPFPGS